MASRNLYSAAMSPASCRYLIASLIGPFTWPGALISIGQPSATAFSQDFAEHLEQPLALLAGGEQPAIFDAEHADGNAAGADQVEHLLVAHAGVEAALEIGAAQFDGVEAALFGRVERGLQRRRIDGPHVQGETPEFLRHGRYCPSYCRM